MINLRVNAFPEPTTGRVLDQSFASDEVSSYKFGVKLIVVILMTFLVLLGE